MHIISCQLCFNSKIIIITSTIILCDFDSFILEFLILIIICYYTLLKYYTIVAGETLFSEWCLIERQCKNKWWIAKYGGLNGTQVDENPH